MIHFDLLTKYLHCGYYSYRVDFIMKKRIVKLFSAFTSKVAEGLLRGGTGKGVVNNVTMKQSNNRLAFTLIELLIVIAVLGILVTGILVVLNPVEQTRRASDSQRASSISQLATAITAYSTSQLSQDYTALDESGWQDVLVTSGEMKQVVKVPTPITNCDSRLAAGAVNVCSCSTDSSSPPVCATSGNISTNIMIWAMLDSKAEATRAGCTSSQATIVAYDSTQQKTGIGCVTNATTEPSFGISLK